MFLEVEAWLQCILGLVRGITFLIFTSLIARRVLDFNVFLINCRSYRNGFVWHDLSEDDLILPAHGNEYVLKGSELFDESNSGEYYFFCYHI